MGIRIDRLQAAILEATAIEAGAKARIAKLREVLDAEARRRFAAEGAAPTWKSRLGAIRYDAPGDWSAVVANEDAFGSYVAERHPEQATAAIRIPAADLPDALQALGFVGITHDDARVEVRSSFRTKYLADLVVDVVEEQGEDGTVDRTIRVLDPATGELVDGVSAARSNAAGKLVVTLDRDAKAAALTAAKAEAEEAIAAATGDAPPLEVRTGRDVTLDELVAKGTVRPASELTAPERATVDRFEQAPDALAEELNPLTPIVAPGVVIAGHRIPYVGEGADGARRSAQIDREEADGYDAGEDRDRALASAERWDAQAAELEAAATEPEEPARIPVDDRDRHVAMTAAEDAKPLREQLAEQLNVTDEEAGVRAVEAMDNREALRRLARAKGINPGGTKRDLAERLYAAGVRA